METVLYETCETQALLDTSNSVTQDPGEEESLKKKLYLCIKRYLRALASKSEEILKDINFQA